MPRPIAKGRLFYYVYILASLSGMLYVGLTDHLPRRLREHKDGVFDGFTKRYKINRLMCFEKMTDSYAARRREIQIKAYRREKKIALFVGTNPSWRDLSPEVFAWGIGPSLRSGSKSKAKPR
ncbi:MAG TPA: GIY-YIG nuclease family protein [Terriglobales bacterium]|nr:GIY-YIG nuclease family protein [Terriglobales bacterium]